MNNKKSLGFSLPELLVTVAVAAVLASFALPNLSTMIQGNGIKSYTNQAISNLYLARSEAAKYGFNVKICAANDGSNVCANSKAYASGWIGFLDLDNNGIFNSAITKDLNGDGTADIAEKILFRSEATNAYALQLQTTVANSITYTPTGTVVGGASNYSFDISLAKASTDVLYRIKFEPTGRVRSCNVKSNTNC